MPGLRQLLRALGTPASCQIRLNRLRRKTDRSPLVRKLGWPIRRTAARLSGSGNLRPDGWVNILAAKDPYQWSTNRQVLPVVLLWRVLALAKWRA